MCPLVAFTVKSAPSIPLIVRAFFADSTIRSFLGIGLALWYLVSESLAQLCAYLRLKKLYTKTIAAATLLAGQSCGIVVNNKILRQPESFYPKKRL